MDEIQNGTKTIFLSVIVYKKRQFEVPSEFQLTTRHLLLLPTSWFYHREWWLKLVSGQLWSVENQQSMGLFNSQGVGLFKANVSFKFVLVVLETNFRVANPHMHVKAVTTMQLNFVMYSFEFNNFVFQLNVKNKYRVMIGFCIVILQKNT